MPFKSKAQQRFMFSQHPQIAKRWAANYGVPKDLPQTTGSSSNDQLKEAAINQSRKKNVS